MFYVGLDVHTKQVTICVLDDDGKLVQRAQIRQLDELKRFLERLGSPFEVCYEASWWIRLLLRAVATHCQPCRRGASRDAEVDLPLEAEE